jgi:MFS family permease
MAFAGVICFAAGYAGLFPTMLAMVVDKAPPAERGQAMGSFNMFFDIGAPLGGFLTGRLVDLSGYGAGFGAMAGIALVGVIVLVAGVADRRTARRRVATPA